MSGRFSPAEIADPLLGTKRLVLAAQDMKDASEAAEALIERVGPARALETAIVVSYARPWTRSTIKRLGDHWLPTDAGDLDLHGKLLHLRKKLYAHTDDDLGARGMRDVSDVSGVTEPQFAPSWRPLDRAVVPNIIALTNRQRERFRDGAGELGKQIPRFTVRVTWPMEALARDERSELLDELQAELFALAPTQSRLPTEDRVVAIELVEPGPGDERPVIAYAVLRLLRATRRWWGRLVYSSPAVHLAIGQHLYVLHPDGPQQHLDPTAIAADHLADPGDGERRWDDAARRFVRIDPLGLDPDG
jgi:hypothetical protein